MGQFTGAFGEGFGNIGFFDPSKPNFLRFVAQATAFCRAQILNLSGPVVERHSLQCSALKNFHVAAVFAGNREERRPASIVLPRFR